MKEFRPAEGWMKAAGSAAEPPRRGIRSFARRQGRITRAQRRALETLWPAYGVEAESLSEPQQVFPREAPIIVEVGFGMGDALAAMAAADRGRNYLGVEVYPPGIGSALLKISQHGLDNVRLVRTDAEELMDAIPGESLDGVLIFFPDPWPKKRHHKRRLIQSPFIEKVYTRLKPHGRFELATDWAPYADQMLSLIGAHGGFVNLVPGGGFAPRPQARPQTKFEHRGEKLGYRIFDLVFERASPAGRRF